MGFTHYYRNKRAFTDAEWKALTADVKKLIADSDVPIGDSHGTRGSKPVFTSRHIMFNGIGEDSHETACVKKDASDFEFCKTARKPYDSVVVEFFKLIRKYDPNVQLSSNGGDEVFNGQRIKVDNKWTYYAGDHDVRVGDKVILPPTPYSGGKNWEGVVTSIGSDYAGYTKTIVSVVKPPTVKVLTLHNTITCIIEDCGVESNVAKVVAAQCINAVINKLRNS